MGRFINADGYASTGQDFLGYNMFAYCNYNPINKSDSLGQLPVPIIKGLISAATSVVCGLICGDTLGEITISAILAFAGAVIEPIGIICTVIDTVCTVVEVTQSTGDLGFGLFMGGVGVAASLCTGENFGKIPGVENFDEAAEMFIDATVGLSANLIYAKSVHDYTDGYIHQTSAPAMARPIINSSNHNGVQSIRNVAQCNMVR